MICLVQDAHQRGFRSGYTECRLIKKWVYAVYLRIPSTTPLLVSDLRLCVLNAAPFENRWWRLTANQETGFTDEMRMHIAWDISPNPTIEYVSGLFYKTCWNCNSVVCVKSLADVTEFILLVCVIISAASQTIKMSNYDLCIDRDTIL